ncbi:MAG: hypothetical protein B7Y43_08625 [Sphingomonas sp. 28-62-20]|uniref:hypothetical protein n=1 Tax=Sphingomonas sp. 28-62-20 TaxID=1970433 RepID=UPI000BD125A7|nr:MAG: hypothetical protein B7Y43_08625 [Sphingomonas sp. 28-62-20]
MTSLIRLGAAAAVTGGGLRVAAAFIPYVPGVAWLEGFYAVIDACLLIGLIGIYLSVSDRVGRLGLAGFAVAAIGQGSIIGPDAVQLGIDFYLAGSVVLLAGLTLLSAAMIGVKAMRSVALLWLSAVGMAVASTILGEVAILAAGALLGGGFAVAGKAVLARPIVDPAAAPGQIARQKALNRRPAQS